MIVTATDTKFQMHFNSFHLFSSNKNKNIYNPLRNVGLTLSAWGSTLNVRIGRL